MAVSHRTTPYGRRRTGLCSGFISRLVENDAVLISIKPGTIRGTPLSLAIPLCSTDKMSSGISVPVTSALLSAPLPNILIGPGTGVAPMRALIQHEVARQMYLKKTAADGPSTMPQSSDSAASTSVFSFDSSSSTPNALLFFGCRKRERDFLYAADWEKINSNLSPYQADSAADDESCELLPGSVTVSAAFSQDQLVKDYVTHKIKAQGALVCQMLQKVSCWSVYCVFSHPMQIISLNNFMLFSPVYRVEMCLWRDPQSACLQMCAKLYALSWKNTQGCLPKKAMPFC